MTIREWLCTLKKVERIKLVFGEQSTWKKSTEILHLYNLEVLELDFIKEDDAPVMRVSLNDLRKAEITENIRKAKLARYVARKEAERTKIEFESICRYLKFQEKALKKLLKEENEDER